MNHCLQIASPLDRFISLLERLDDSSNRLHIGLGVGKLVFPEGVLWDKENRVPRTGNMNPFFAQIGFVARSARGMDIKNKDGAEALSCLVAGGGLEPPTSGL